MNRKNNCLNTIRILAALQVFVGHASVHLNATIPQYILFPLRFLSGVPIFFIISGFVIWNSLGNTTDFKIYAEKRICRLYPELWGGVLCSVVSLMILYRDNISWNSFIVWIITQSTILQFWTPEYLRGFGCGTPNGSLWTIGVIVQAYIVLWVLYRLLHGKSLKRWCTVLAMGIGLNIITPLLAHSVPVIIYKLFNQTFLPYIWIFILGAMFCEYFEIIIEALRRYWCVFLTISVLVSILNFDVGAYGTLKILFLAPAIIGFAYRYSGLNVKYDISYGLYIYHMIVINVMIQLGYTGKIECVVLALFISVLFAIISFLTLGKLSKMLKGKTIGQVDSKGVS